MSIFIVLLTWNTVTSAFARMKKPMLQTGSFIISLWQKSPRRWLTSLLVKRRLMTKFSFVLQHWGIIKLVWRLTTSSTHYSSVTLFWLLLTGLLTPELILNKREALFIHYLCFRFGTLIVVDVRNIQRQQAFESIPVMSQLT